MNPNLTFDGSVKASREQQLEQELLHVKAELAAVKARAQEDISVRDLEIARLANKEACQAAMLGHLRWKMEKVTAEGRRLAEEAKRNGAIMTAIMRMGKEELSARVLPQVYWIAGVCYEAQIHVDLDGLARQLAGGGSALHATVRRVEEEVSSKVEAAPASAEAKRTFLDRLPPCPPLPQTDRSAMATVIASSPTTSPKISAVVIPPLVPDPQIPVPPHTSRPPSVVISQAAPGPQNLVPPPTPRPPPVIPQVAPGPQTSVPPPILRPPSVAIPQAAPGPQTPNVPAVIPAPILLPGPAPVANALTARAVISNDKDDEDRVVSGKNRRRLQ